MLQDILFFIGGLILLVGGGQFLVNPGVSAAAKFKIAPFIVGATVVAFGTSAPELLVSVKAALSGHSEIALGNVVGSNIANIALVLGTTACILTLPILSKRLFNDWLLVTATSILLIIFCTNNVISVLEGIILVGILITYIYKAINSPREETESKNATYSKWSVIIIALLSSGIALALGASLLVEGASNIARSLNISDRVISITIVAFGTSLPELVTSIIAAIKKQTDISIGNIIGSNLFNILAVLGITAIIKPIAVDFTHFSFDLYVMLAVVLLLFILIYPFKNNIKAYKKNQQISILKDLTAGKLTYIGGILLLLSYIAYILLLFV